MSGFQYIGLAVVGFLLLLTIGAMGTRRVGRPAGLIWSAIWVLGVIALLDPEFTTRIANTVGIRRGADLLLYLLVIVMTVGFFSMYLRLRQLRREFTLLVRRLSIMEVESGGDAGERSR